MFGLSYLMEGRLHDAARILEAVAGKANERIGRYSAASVLPAGYLAAIYYEWNEIGQIREIVQNRLETAIEACSLGPLAGFYISSARLAVIDGDLDEAERLIRDAETIAQSRGWLRMEAACKSEAIRLCILRDDLPRAARVFHTLQAIMPEQPADFKGSVRETWQRVETGRSRWLIASGAAAEAVAALRFLTTELDAGRLPYLAAQARVLLAVALQHAGNTRQALQELAVALRYGQRNSMMRSIIDEGEAVKPLLEALHADQAGVPELERWYTSNLLNQFRSQAAGAGKTTQAGSEKVSEKIAASRLSAREIEILDHVARGLSNKEIAKAIRVAPETVKWHLKNIYEKLNVTSRIQAVQSGLGFDLPRAPVARVS
jgi:LuxR family maltose regulon positive regulatory protein